MPKKLDIEKKTIAISMLCEGNSIRGVERMTGIHRDTIMRLAVRVGNGMKQIQSDMFTGLHMDHVQVDEVWGFIGAKKATVKRGNVSSDEYGDVWTWIAIDAETKLVPCWHVGGRSYHDASAFIADLRERLVNRPQISSDALKAYELTIGQHFGSEVDHGSVIKTFKRSDLGTTRYSPPEVISIKKEVKHGNPDEDLISTSFVEKQHHTLRMHNRRLARLTNAFSKKRENFEAAIAMHYGYYNLVKTHKTIKCTPAMEAGKSESFWTVRDMVEQGEAANA